MPRARTAASLDAASHVDLGRKMEKEDFDRLRRPGIDPRAQLVSAPPAPPPRPRRSHHARPRPSRREEPSSLDVSRRRALRSMREFREALERELGILTLKRECLDQAIALLTGEASVEEVLRKHKMQTPRPEGTTSLAAGIGKPPARPAMGSSSEESPAGDAGIANGG